MRFLAAMLALGGSYFLVGPALARADTLPPGTRPENGSPPMGSPPAVVYPGNGWPAIGRAGDPVVSVGGIFSYTGREGADSSLGAGVETSVARFAPGSVAWIGAVVQAQIIADRPVHGRLALGLQGGFGPFGAELSAYTEGAGRLNARTYGAQLVPFIAIPLLYVGFRIALPLNRGDSATMPSYGTEYGLVIGSKFPINPRGFGHSLH